MDAPRRERMSAPGKTEPAEAISRARTGDAEAWGELYREYAPAIFCFCRRAMPTREDAEDATMDIFMKLKDKLVQYDQTRSFTAWLYKVAANHCWDLLRRRKTRASSVWIWCWAVSVTWKYFFATVTTAGSNSTVSTIKFV